MLTRRLAPSPSHGELSRTLLQEADCAALSTLTAEPPDFPFGSLVSFAVEVSGNVILLLSDLAEHTQNLRHSPKASLMVSERTGDDPLAGGRVTLLGEIAAVEPEEVRALYLTRHPGAVQYVDFKDFNFFRLSTQSVRYVGGFGRMSWVDLEAYRSAQADPIAPSASGIIKHMNEDHVHNMLEMIRHRTEIVGTQAVMTGVDRYGFTIDVETADGPALVRLGFTHPLDSGGEVRKDMVELVRLARAALEPAS